MIDGRAEQPTWQARVLERLEWRDLLQVAIALHVAAFILITLFISGDFNLDSVHLYMTYGQEVMDGKIPYQDFDIEYPPLAVPLFALPTLVTHDILAYRALFALEMIAFDLIGVVIGLWALRRLAPGIGPWGVLLVQPLLLLAAGKSIVLERFDIAPAVLTLAAIVLFSARRSGWAWLVLGLATVMKIYPVVLAPLFLLFAYRREGIWKQLDNLGIFALGIAVPTLIITRGDLVPMQRFLVYHAARGLEIESLPASLLMLPALFGNTAGLDHIFAFGSEQLVAPLAPLFATLAMPLMAVVLLGLYFVAWRYTRRLDPDADNFQDLLELSVVAILVFMLVNKVLSAQYPLWIFPLVTLFIRRREGTWLLFGSALLLTLWIFPYNWFELTSFKPLAVAILFLRNLELIGLGALLLVPYLAKANVLPARIAKPARTASTPEPMR